MLPRFFGENLFDDWFGFPEFRDVDRKLYGHNAPREMKTDVHEHEDRYEMRIDLPGFKKDEISLTLENGYLTVSAAKGLDMDREQQGRVIRRERYAGAMRRSFYVGEGLTEEDIRAKYEHGVLSLTIPKKEVRRLPEKRSIMIEG